MIRKPSATGTVTTLTCGSSSRNDSAGAPTCAEGNVAFLSRSAFGVVGSVTGDAAG